MWKKNKNANFKAKWHFTILGLWVLHLASSVQSFTSEGTYAITDSAYDGTVSDGWNAQYLIDYKVLSSGDMYSVAAVRECKSLCIDASCKSFVMDRLDHLCYLTSFDRCLERNVPLRTSRSEYITYDMIYPGSMNGTNGKTTCFKKCISDTKGCDSCGRLHCSGGNCDNCKKTCWEIDPIYNVTTFWIDLAQDLGYFCMNEWQAIYWNKLYYIYYYLVSKPLYLQLKIYFNDGTILDSYFDSFWVSAEAAITVGNYIGGPAGNSWGAPFSRRELANCSNSNCIDFYYGTTNCSVKNLHTLSYQKGKGYNPIIRGFMWNICNFTTSSYVEIIEMRITLASKFLTNNPTFFTSLPYVKCT